MPVTRPGVGTGAGSAVGDGATVNVHVAFCSATPTALPASSADSKTTCGHSKAVPLTHAGMPLMICRRARPVCEGLAVLRLEAHPHGQEREGRAVAEETLLRLRHLADRDALDVVFPIGEQDHRRSDRVGRQVLGRLLHGGDVVGIDADLAGECGSRPLR